MTVSLDDSMIPETYDNIADDQTYDRIEDPATYTATETIQDAAAEQAKAVESDADDQDYKPGNDYAPSSPGSSIYLHTVWPTTSVVVVVIFATVTATNNSDIVSVA